MKKTSAMSDIFRSADYARAKEKPARCKNEQHAWMVNHVDGHPTFDGWHCQICDATRKDNPVKSHDELRKMCR